MSDDLFTLLHGKTLDALRALVPDLAPELAARVELTPARVPAQGDLATNAALIAARPAQRKPAELAAALARALANEPEIDAAEPAGPGFVNLRLRPAALQAELPRILRSGPRYGDSRIGAGTRINVEYVSANPTGPMHIGHCRGAVVGDALAGLLDKAGYHVTREFYVNDAGAQVIALAWATYWRYLQALGTPLTEAAFSADVPGGFQYPGDYLVPIGAALAERHGEALAGPGKTVAPSELWLDTVRDFAVGTLLERIREDLASLGVRQEVFTSERALLESGAVERAIETLRSRGLIYEGVLEPPKGKLPEDWEPRPQLLFRATAFGDDTDRPLRKSDGSNTYFANDIAYHADKIARGAQAMIDVWGADHGGYVPRMKAAVEALAPAGETLQVLLCQIVHVMRGGEPVRMSKRAGTFITLRDLIDEVGAGAVRFTMLMRKPDAQMEFDIDLARAQTRENPVFYVQYAHARCRSVLRRAEASPEALADADFSVLTDPAELALLRRMAAWPRTVEGAAQAREPHRIAFFLYDLAGDFHMLWNRGNEAGAELRFIQPDRPRETQARVGLVAAVATVLRSGLAVLGVEPMEEMR